MEIIDNFMPLEDYTAIKTSIMSLEFPWYYTEFVSAPKDKIVIPENIINVCRESDGFFHPIFNVQKPQNTSPVIEIFQKFFTALETIGYAPGDLITLRVNMLLPKHGYTKDIFHPPHVDCLDMLNETVIFYVNDSDGDTVLFNQRTTDLEEKYTISERIPPKGNRLLIFDGDQYHAGSLPIQSDRRIVINSNLQKRKVK